MRKLVAVLLLLLFLPGGFTAEAALPDLSPFLNVQGQRQMTDYTYDNMLCDVWVFARNSYTEAGCGYWLLDCLEAGFSLQKITLEGYAAYQVTDSAHRRALLLPDYGGVVMLMVETTLPYAPALPTPAPMPAITQPPSPGSSAGHWERVTVEKDCPACVGGSCSVCKGTGVYRLYGQSVNCSKTCTSCNGAGTYESSQLVWVND